jgi:hypothetical protein
MTLKLTLVSIPSRGLDTTAAEVLRDKLVDALTPGFEAEFDPYEAVAAGAFAEDALSEVDARASSEDLPDAGQPASRGATEA